jgi:hypothetical protein
MLGWLIPAAGFALTLFAWSQGWRIWIFIFALSVFLIFEPTLLRRRMLHKQFRNQPHLHAPLDVTINAEGISSQSSFNTGSSRWEMLGPWAEDEKTVLILVKGANIFYTFPKRQLSREQIGNLRELLKNHIKLTASCFNFSAV